VWNFSLFSQHTDRPIPSLEHFTLLGGKKRKEKREERESFSISFLGRSEPAASKTGSSSRTWNSVPSVAGRSTTHTHDLLCYKSFSWWSFSCVIWNWRNNINNRMSYRGYVSHIPLFPWVDFNYTWWPYPIVCAKSVTVITRDIYARYYYYYYKSEPIQSDPFAHHYSRWHIWVHNWIALHRSYYCNDVSETVDTRRERSSSLTEKAAHWATLTVNPPPFSFSVFLVAWCVLWVGRHWRQSRVVYYLKNPVMSFFSSFLSFSLFRE
jgi:hypothetical protein